MSLKKRRLHFFLLKNPCSAPTVKYAEKMLFVYFSGPDTSFEKNAICAPEVARYLSFQFWSELSMYTLKTLVSIYVKILSAAFIMTESPIFMLPHLYVIVNRDKRKLLKLGTTISKGISFV